jgi:drug/metabolite transporter (DMT)-like permease
MKKAFLQLHIAVFLAGFTGILGRLIHLNEAWLVWYRLLITAATMWILFAITKKLKRVSRVDIIKLFGLGFLSAMHWVTFYGSIKKANVSVALVCFSSIGFFTALFEPLLHRSRIKWIDLLLGLMVMGGIYLIFHFDSEYKTGIMLGIASAVFISIAMIIFRQFVHRSNPETVLTYQLTGGFLTLSAIMPLYEMLFPSTYFIPTLNDWKWLFILAWLCSVIAFQFTGHALKKLSAFTVNLTFNLEPVYGIALAFLVYNENKFLSKWFFAGLAMIMGALLLHIILLYYEHKRKIGKTGLS